MALLLMNYAKLKGYDVSLRADLSGYSDAGSISEWATRAMYWAVAAGLIQGSGGKLMPKESAERCQAAAMFHRFADYFAG